MTHWLISIFLRSSGLYRSRNNPTKFAIFRDNRDNIFRGKQRTLSDQFKPNRCLIKFLEYDFELMNEIGATFCASRLAVISGRGSA